jgi:DNA-binding SARP family transcriptional activator
LGEQVQLYTLGGVELRRDHHLVNNLASRKAQALLIYLTIEKHPKPREVLASLLWEDRSNARALGNLRVVLTSLKRELDPLLRISRYTVGLTNVEDIWFDVAEFEQSCTRQEIATALDLYRGDFLEGFHLRGCRKFDEWALFERERLRNQLIQTLQGYIQHCIDCELFEEALAQSAHLLRLNPLMESGHRNVMQTLMHMDRKVDALQHYQQYNTLLRDELDVDPGQGIQKLQQKIIRTTLN